MYKDIVVIIRAGIRMNCLDQFPEAGAGLQNLGNTCFVNAVVQSMLHSPQVRHCLSLHQEN